jgi:hypothetical protein
MPGPKYADTILSTTQIERGKTYFGAQQERKISTK